MVEDATELYEYRQKHGSEMAGEWLKGWISGKGISAEDCIVVGTEAIRLDPIEGVVPLSPQEEAVLLDEIVTKNISLLEVAPTDTCIGSYAHGKGSAQWIVNGVNGHRSRAVAAAQKYFVSITDPEIALATIRDVW